MLKRLTNGEFALALLVASLFWIAVLAWATSYAPANPDKKACYQAAEKSGRSTEECKTFWERTTSDPIAMFTLVLAVSTVGLWTATILLYFAGERQLAHAKSESEAADFHRNVQYDQISEQITALKDSAVAAEESARETRNLVWNAEATAERQLRAYVHVRDVVMSEMNSGFNPNIEVIIKNFGQTPAREIVNTHEVKVAIDPRESSFALDRAKRGEIVDLAPGQETFSRFSIPFNQWEDMKPELNAKKQVFYVFGRIDYIDVFNKPRWTEYRYELTVDSRGILDETSLVVDGYAGNRAS